MKFKIKIEQGARLDIQETITWYNEKKKGLGKKYHSAILKHIDGLKTNPHFLKKYDNVHCLPIKKYPFMIHFTIDKVNKIISVRAVLHTSLSPKVWKR